MRPGVEALLKEALRAWYSGGVVVFEAPTGYGKTRAGPLLYNALPRGGRVIHVLPLRSIVEEAYRAYREGVKGPASIGYQAHGLSLAGKTPFYAADAVVSTLDSFTFNLYRSSVGERGLGHYEVPRAHIVSSITIMDEAHLPLTSREAPATAMAATIYSLYTMRVPLVVETATMPPRLLRALLELALPPGARVVYLEVTPPGGAGRPRWLPEGVEYHAVADGDYYEWASSLEWRYYPIPAATLEDVVEVAARLVESGLRVFLASSTVRGAIDYYKALAERLGGEGVALIHGRLTVSDREEHLKRSQGASVVVGTSAVEAGVNIDADAVITDVPVVEGAPAWDSIIQRLGRACRSPKHACDGVDVYLYGTRAAEAYKQLAGRGVNPRVPESYRGLLDSSAGLSIDPSRYGRLVELALRHAPHARISEVYRELCQPLRGDALVPIVIPSPDAPEGDPAGLARDALEALEAGRYVLASLSNTQRRARDWLLRLDGGYAALRLDYAEGSRGHPEDLEAEIVSVSHEVLGNCSRMAGLAALISRPGAYEPGVGMP